MLEKVTKPGAKAKAKAWWQWNETKGKAKRDWTQFRVQRKMPKTPWMGIAGILAVAGLGTWLAMKGSEKKAGKYPQSGQAPSRSHIRMSSHPAAAGRVGT